MREVVIVDSVRTGLAKSFRGKFNQTRPDDMAAHCVNALLTRNDIDPTSIEDCIVGMRPGITSCVIKPAATYAEAAARSHSPAASAGA